MFATTKINKKSVSLVKVDVMRIQYTGNSYPGSFPDFQRMACFDFVTRFHYKGFCNYFRNICHFCFCNTGKGLFTETDMQLQEYQALFLSEDSQPPLLFLSCSANSASHLQDFLRSKGNLHLQILSSQDAKHDSGLLSVHHKHPILFQGHMVNGKQLFF